jgi:chitin disaccharide deacetylase
LSWLKSQSELSIGLHVNLTYGPAILTSCLTTKEGIFKHSFSSLAIKSFCYPSFRRAIKDEVVAQYDRITNNSFEITHIDSHRHVHLIPWLFPLIYNLTSKRYAKRIRLINENPLQSFKLFNNAVFIKNGGLLKWLVLQFCSMFLRRCYKIKSHSNSSSVAFTGCAVRSFIHEAQVQKGFELIVHPSFPDEDLQEEFYDHAEKAYRLDAKRWEEYDALKKCVMKKSNI